MKYFIVIVDRKRWTTPERQIVEQEFVEYYDKYYLPSIEKCKNVIQKHSILSHRQPSHLKAKVNNDLKRKQNELDKIRKQKKYEQN